MTASPQNWGTGDRILFSRHRRRIARSIERLKEYAFCQSFIRPLMTICRRVMRHFSPLKAKRPNQDMNSHYSASWSRPWAHLVVGCLLNLLATMA